MLNRRRLLHLSAASAALVAFDATAPALAADEYDLLRQRWIDKTMLGTGYSPAEEPFATVLQALGATAAGYRSAMAPTAGSLWPDLPAGTVSANVTSSYLRLKLMAQAWAFPGTGGTGDNGLLASVLTGLDWMHANAYTPLTGTYNNWWDWQIGSPRHLLDTAAVVYGSLTPTQVSNYCAAIDHFVPDSAVTSATGANRVDLSTILILRGVVGKNGPKIATGRNQLSPVFPLVRNGDGFYADGSFIQHARLPYTGTYGAVLIGGLASLFALLAGSSWPVTDPRRQFIFDAVPNAIAPFLFNGLMMDSQSGRAISRGIPANNNPLQLQQDDHTRGHSLIASILLLAEAAPASEAAQWRSMAKGWLQRDYYSPILNDKLTSLPALARGKAVLGDPSVTAAPEPSGSKVFGSMDRAAHRRPGFAFAVAMCSGRTGYYESINGENLRGWHTSAGMTYWWGNTFGNGQYSDAYWPTVDPYRLPGTTVSRKPLAHAQGGNGSTPAASAAWTGGATDGTYAALGQDTRGLASTLSARKAWFCLDDQIVCLGAAITSSDGYAVETTVDNRNLGPAGAHGLTVDGVLQPGTPGWSSTFAGASWTCITGFGGYVFPGGATLNAVRETRTGSWHDINNDASTASLSRRFVTLWLSHGTNPAGASYSYILMPGASSATTAARAASPTVSILANTAAAQAIHDSAAGVTLANFYSAGTAAGLTVSAPCSVVMRESGGTLSISVSDPTRAATTITVSVNRSGFTTAAADSTVSVTGLNPLTVVAETGGTQGASHTIRFGTGSPVQARQTASLAPAADAYVRDGSYAGTNYGTAADLVVKTGSSAYQRKSFLKFDLSSLPAAPGRAVLWVSGLTADSAGTQATVTAYGVSDNAWTETGLTWNNQPALGAALSTGAIGSVRDWIALDVTSHVQARYAGDGVVTVALAEAAAGVAVVLNSRSAPALQPFLHLIT